MIFSSVSLSSRRSSPDWGKGIRFEVPNIIEILQKKIEVSEVIFKVVSERKKRPAIYGTAQHHQWGLTFLSHFD